MLWEEYFDMDDGSDFAEVVDMGKISKLVTAFCLDVVRDLVADAAAGGVGVPDLVRAVGFDETFAFDGAFVHCFFLPLSSSCGFGGEFDRLLFLSFLASLPSR